jgi:mRNA interferase HigB
LTAAGLTVVPKYGNINGVRIVGVSKLDEFARRHAGARKSLANWEKVVRPATWKNSEGIQRTFNSVDYAERKTIFDVGGNNFRLIALVDFEKQLVLVSDVMTHAEYEKERWKK